MAKFDEGKVITALHPEKAESEIYTNEKHCEKCIFFAECVESAIEDRCEAYRESYKDYLNGLAEGKPKWHDLRKDPNDLPEKSGEYWCKWEDGTYSTEHYFADSGFGSYVISWTELPKFEE